MDVNTLDESCFNNIRELYEQSGYRDAHVTEAAKIEEQRLNSYLNPDNSIKKSIMF